MAGEGQVIVCRTAESWNQQLEKGKESNKLIVVDFTASWCGPCKFIAPAVEELAWKLPDVTFLKVDVDELQSVAQEWDVQAMPTFIFLKDGEIAEKYTGANKMKLQEAVEKHANENIGIFLEVPVDCSSFGFFSFFVNGYYMRL